MPTPGNSVLDRATASSSNDYLTRIVSENEDLKMQIEDLNEKLAKSGLSQLYQLQEENEALTIELSQLRVQLDERDNQIQILRNSDNRFENINNSLQELLSQVASQRKELAELKFVVQEKEATIASLQAEIKHKNDETAAMQARQQQQQQEQQAAAAAAAAAQLHEAEGRFEQQQREAREALARTQAQLQEKEQEVIALKEGVAQQSQLRCERERASGAAAALQADLAAAQAREVAAEKQKLEAQNALQEKTKAWEALQQECAAAQAQIQTKLQEQQQLQKQLEEAKAAAAAKPAVAPPAADAGATFTGSSSSSDIKTLCSTNKDARAYVLQKISEACADRDARLSQQVNENAHLLSRMAILQEESENLVKKLKAAKEQAAAAGAHSLSNNTNNHANPAGGVDYSKEAFTSGVPVGAPPTAPPPTIFANLELNSLKERVDHKSKMVGKRSTMEKRIADFLSPLTNNNNNNNLNNNGDNQVTMINMRDLELLLQELLNYQEDTENESSTRLLIKDMEMEDELAKLFATIRRLENERDSLMKQLQKEAFRTVKTTPKKTDPVHNVQIHNNNNTNAAHPLGATGADTSGLEGPGSGSASSTAGAAAAALGSPPPASASPSSPAPALAAAAAAPGVGQLHPLYQSNNNMNNNNNNNNNVFYGKPTPSHNMTAVPLYADPHAIPHAAAATAGTPPRGQQQPPPPPPSQKQQQQPQPNANNNKNNNNNVHFQENVDGQRKKTYNELLNEQNRRNLGLHVNNNNNTNKVSIPHGPLNKDIFVCCPACTYEQKYGNVKCELCNTELVFYH